MRRIIPVICLLAAFTTNAQTNESLKAQAAQIKQQIDSTNRSLEATMNRLKQSQDSARTAQIQKDAARNGEMILRLYNERQAKQKKQMFLYLGLGIFFLAVLVFGLMRKGKKKVS